MYLRTNHAKNLWNRTRGSGDIGVQRVRNDSAVWDKKEEKIPLCRGPLRSPLLYPNRCPFVAFSSCPALSRTWRRCRVPPKTSPHGSCRACCQSYMTLKTKATRLRSYYFGHVTHISWLILKIFGHFFSFSIPFPHAYVPAVHLDMYLSH